MKPIQPKANHIQAELFSNRGQCMLEYKVHTPYIWLDNSGLSASAYLKASSNW